MEVAVEELDLRQCKEVFAVVHGVYEEELAKYTAVLCEAGKKYRIVEHRELLSKLIQRIAILEAIEKLKEEERA